MTYWGWLGLIVLVAAVGIGGVLLVFGLAGRAADVRKW
jgi:hypothetical protein